jgi:NADH dehydrogenase
MHFCGDGQVEKMKVALIGGTGFVGGYLVDALLDANHEPSVLVRPGSEGKVRQPDSCRIVSGEVADSDALRQLFDGADAVIYNIGILRAFPGQGITFEKLHYEGAARAMDLARECGVSRFLLMSANGIRKGGTPYQHTKALAEEHLAGSGLDYTIFRPSVIFGDPRGAMEIATQLYQDMIRVPLPGVGFHNGLIPGKSPVVMSPVHARDVADAFVASLADETTFGQVIEIGGPEVLSWPEMLERIAAAVGKRKLVLPMPIGFMKLGATLLDWLPFFPVTRDQLTMLAEGNVAQPAALRELIGREPVAFDPASLDYLAA